MAIPSIKNKKIKFFTINLLCKFIVALCILAPLFFFGKFLVNEKKSFSQFVDYVMLQQTGVYTLMDFKPVSHIIMDYTPPSKGEKYQIWSNFSDDLKMKYSVDDVFFPSHDCPKILKNWEKIQSKFVGTKYRFIIDNDRSLYFINIPLTLSTIQEHEKLFKEALGQDISPQEIVNSIGDNSSAIWKMIEQGHLMRGILFGYGLHNSREFEKFSQKTVNKLAGTFSTVPTMAALEKHPKVTSLNLPLFRVFEGGDAQVELYKKRKQEIIEICNKMSFYQLVRERLKEDYLQEERIH